MNPLTNSTKLSINAQNIQPNLILVTTNKLPIYTWFRYSTGTSITLSRTFPFGVTHTFQKIPNTRKVLASRRRLYRSFNHNQLTLKQSQTLRRTQKLFNKKYLVHPSSFWSINFLETTSTWRALGNGPRGQTPNHFKKWTLTYRSTDNTSVQTDVLSAFKKILRLFNKKITHKWSTKLSLFLTYVGSFSKTTNAENQKTTSLMTNKLIQRNYKSFDFDTYKSFWSKPHAYLNLKHKTSKFSINSKYSLVAKIKAAHYKTNVKPRLIVEKFFPHKTSKKNLGKVQFVKRLQRHNTLFRVRVQKSTLRVQTREASYTVQRLLQGSNQSARSLWFHRLNNAKGTKQAPIGPYLPLTQKQQHFTTFASPVTLLTKVSKTNRVSQVKLFKRYPIINFKALKLAKPLVKLSNTELRKFYKLFSREMVAQSHKRLLPRLIRPSLNIFLFHNYNTFSLLRRFTWSAPIRRMWRKAKKDLRRNFTKSVCLSTILPNFKIKDPKSTLLAHRIKAYPVKVTLAQREPTLSLFKAVSAPNVKPITRAKSYAPLKDSYYSLTKLTTYLYNFLLTPYYQTKPNVVYKKYSSKKLTLLTPKIFFGTSGFSYQWNLFFPAKHFRVSKVSSRSAQLALHLSPLYSLRFRTSMFFFTHLELISKNNVVDAIRTVTTHGPSLDYLVFPDANEIKSSIFRRLNTQRLLLQDRMARRDQLRSYQRGKNQPTVYPFSPTPAHNLDTLSSGISYTASRWLEKHFYARNHQKGDPTPRIRRIRFKPGYGRIWRLGRTSIREILNLKSGYQYRLTPKLQKRYFQARSNLTSLDTFTLDFALMMSNFTPDSWSSKELIQSSNVYLNGRVCLNGNTHLFINDFIQLLINLKYYLVMKWVKNWSIVKRNRVLKYSIENSSLSGLIAT